MANILPSANIVSSNNKSIVTLELGSSGFGTKWWDYYKYKN